MTKEAPKKGGFRDAAPKEFREELLQIDRVTRVTAGGRQLRFRASVVIGDGKGRVGLGIGKAGEVVVAIEKAVRDAKKNIIKVQIIEGTIAHNITADYKAASIMLHPASQGTGIIAGGAVRKIISVSGIKDILAKRYGSTNAITNARATLKALAGIKQVVVAPKKSLEEEKVILEEKVTEEITEVKEEKVVEKTETKTVAPKKAPAKKPTAKK